MLSAATEGVQISPDTEKAAPCVDQDRSDVRTDSTFGGEMIEFLGEPIVERIAAVSLIHREMRNAVENLEGESRQLHRRNPRVSEKSGARQGEEARLRSASAGPQAGRAHDRRWGIFRATSALPTLLHLLRSDFSI
jgi:hypothetical protein